MEADMRYILQVWQDGSFSKAAEALYMTQPALSLAVKRVEENLGAELFDRSHRPLELTQAGKIYIDTILQIRHLENELHNKVEDLRHLNTGILRIGGTHYINSYILAPALAGFSRKYPGIQIELSEAGADILTQSLDSRDIDLMFSCDPDILSHFDSSPVFQDNVLLAVPQSAPVPETVRSARMSAADVLGGRHKEPGCPSVSLAEFRDLDFIVLKNGTNLHTRSIQMFEDAGFAPKIKMSLSQMVTAYRLADNAMGATLISDRIVTAPDSHLDFYKIQSDLTVRQFYILQSQRNYTPFAVREFVEYAREHI